MISPEAHAPDLYQSPACLTLVPDLDLPCELEKDALSPPRAWGEPVGSARSRVEAEDFQVFEQGLVTPVGDGEHCWLYIRKRNSNTAWVARQLAQLAGTGIAQVSYAGMKDRRAVTEQWFSVHLPGQAEPDWSSLDCDELQVLHKRRHTRKLQRGTLRGNRFRLCLRELEGRIEAIEQRLVHISKAGFPNYFGEQRFGRGGDNLFLARRWFDSPRRRMTREKRSLYLSAVRSALFNRVLAARVGEASWNRALAGDALQLEGKSACFVNDQTDEHTQERVELLQVHPTGPLCGQGDSLATGEALELERAVLHDCEFWMTGLQQQRVKAARRALRVAVPDLHGSLDDEGNLIVEFSLPPGAYATSLLREVLVLR